MRTYGHQILLLVAAIWVSDPVIVETADAVLVAHKDRVRDVKKVVERLQREGRGEAVLHRKVFRPWGSYEGVDSGERFQVKRIIVTPGVTLSLPMHYHRASFVIPGYVIPAKAGTRNASRIVILDLIRNPVKGL
ncbi:hypothetical protein GCM10027046_34140 [Uliginosibacterium flavum]